MIIIGIAGGTGSGKTTVSQHLMKRVGNEKIVYLQHDSYYKDQSHLSEEVRERVNYDHPDVLETSLLVEHVLRLKAGYQVDVPLYNFKTHTRRSEKEEKIPQSIILIEGIFVLVDEDLRNLIDIKVFVDTDADIRFERRLERDIRERGRSKKSVIHQYKRTVKPMHEKFVEPSKHYADILIAEGGFNIIGLEMILTKIKLLSQHFNEL